MPLEAYSYEPPFDETWKYDSIVGMFMYPSIKYSPDIQFSVNQCARLTKNPSKSNDDAVNRICRYLFGTQGKVLTFDPNSDMNLDWYVDADFAGLWKHKDDQDTVCIKSRNGYVMTLSVC